MSWFGGGKTEVEETYPEKYKVVNPLTTLTDEQKDKMAKLREITKKWTLQEKEQKFLDDMCLYRFLSGLKWDLEVTEKQLKETVDWRIEYNPEAVTIDDDLEPLAKQGHMFHIGFDRYSRPIVYFIMGRDKLENDEKNQLLKFRYLVYVMENVVKVMPEGIYKVTWVIDLKDSNLSLSVIKQVAGMFSKLGDYYTERLAMCLVTNYSWSIGIIWACVSAFLAPETVAKYKMIKGSKEEVLKQFKPVIDENELITEFFGKKEYKFDLEALKKLSSTEK